MPPLIHIPADLVASPTLALQVEELQRLLADESQRREAFIDAIQPHEKGEFINGEVVMHSPARAAHVEITSRVDTLLRTHVQCHQLGKVMVEKAMVSLTRNDYEPDICFFGREKSAEIHADSLRFPAPDLAVEVLSPGTEARDLGIKMDDYAAHGVAEYWIIDPSTETVEQYVSDDAEPYTLRMKSGSGVLESVAVEGFAVPVRALFDDDANLTALRDLLG
jgi:Uma2 family endonuclease